MAEEQKLERVRQDNLNDIMGGDFRGTERLDERNHSELIQQDHLRDLQTQSNNSFQSGAPPRYRTGTNFRGDTRNKPRVATAGGNTNDHQKLQKVYGNIVDLVSLEEAQ